MKRALFLVSLISLFIFSACTSTVKDSKESKTEKEEVFVQNAPLKTITATNKQDCFLELSNNNPIVTDDGVLDLIDSLYLYINTDAAGNVEGVYNFIPGETDSRTGVIKGKLVDGRIEAIYTFSAEGDEYEEDIIFEISAKEVVVKESSQVVRKIPRVNCK